MPLSKYIHTSHLIGAKMVKRLLQNPTYKAEYIRKMKCSVSDSILRRMSETRFRETWEKKAKSGSLKGNARISELMLDPSFSSSWSAKCSLGGNTVAKLQKGIFNPALLNARRLWSQKGLRRTSRKYVGPQGENMYNYLEIRVAKILMAAGLRYFYEKHFASDTKNGFFSVDFLVESLNLAIEATYWDKVMDKCSILRTKFKRLKRINPSLRFVVVTKTSLADKYKKSLPSNIVVLTPPELEQMIMG